MRGLEDVAWSDVLKYEVVSTIVRGEQVLTLRTPGSRHRLALCRRASLERKLEQHSLMSLLTTREVCTTGSGPLERILSRTTRGRTGHEIKN